jgi:hypothetical protein
VSNRRPDLRLQNTRRLTGTLFELTRAFKHRAECDSGPLLGAFVYVGHVHPFRLYSACGYHLDLKDTSRYYPELLRDLRS